MDSDSKSGGFPQNCGFISPSMDGVCQTAGDLSPREMILTMKSQSWGRVVSTGTCHPGITLHNSRESCLLSFFEFSKGCNEKRCIRNDGMSDVPAEQDLTLVLGLGCTPGSLNSGGRLALGNSVGAFCVEGGEQDGSCTDLGLSLKALSGCEVTNNCMTTSGGIVSTVTALSRSPLDLEIEGHQYGLLEIGTLRNTHLQLGSLQSSSQDLDCGGDGISCTVLVSNSGESACGMDLQLGLSGTSLGTESDCLSGTPFRKNGGDAQENRLDIMANEHIPLVDEGSTSARWMKSGGYMTSLLRGSHARANQTSNLGKSISAAEDPTEPESDLFMSRKESTVSASACEAVGGFSGQTSKMTAAASSTGALAGTSDRTSKACKFKGCGKGARGASGLCIAHGGGQRCQRPNCNKGAEGRTMYCKAHGGGRRCQILGCIKSAEGKTDLCIGHGGGRRCSHEGCNKAARGKSGLCIRHGGGKRCQKEGCTKSAEGFSGLCISHGGGRRCQYPACGKGAQGSTMFCKAHGGGRRCMYEGCTKGAEGSTPFCKAHGGGKRCIFGGGTCTKSVHGGTLFCVAHGGGKRCAEQGCSKSARGRTDHCVRHGGGKRCKFEDCSKSAQGSTDFCKAHGGGKRCSWCQEGSIYSGDNLIDKGVDSVKVPCDRFARGKAGLCAAHSALMQHPRVTWDGKPCSSPSRSTMHDPLQEAVAMSVHNGQNLEAFSDASEQTFRFSSVPGHDEQLSGFAEAQSRQCARASLEDSWSNKHHMESRSCHAAKIASRRCFASDVASQDIPFDECGTDVYIRRPRCWLSLPQVCLRNKIAASMNGTECAARKTTFFADAQQAYEKSPNSVALPDTGSSFFSSQKVVLPTIQKDDLLLPDKRQHAQYSSPNSASEDASRFSLLAPEERVHGGGLMALLAKETTRHGDLQ